MRFILFILLLLISAALGTLQFSDFAQLRDPALIQQVQLQLLEEFREKSTDQFNQSLEKEPIGKILHRAADIFTTRVTLVDTSKSQRFRMGNPPGPIIVYARFLVENSSDEPLETERYLHFRHHPESGWTYYGLTTSREYYKNFLTID